MHMYLLTLLNKFLETYEQHPIPQVLRVGNRLLIILHLRLNTAVRWWITCQPPKKNGSFTTIRSLTIQDLVVSCMVVVGSNFFEHRIHPWFRITKTSCHFGLHIALNAIGLLPCKMILVAKCCHFMCTPWYAMLVSFPLVSFVEKLGNNEKKNSSGDNNRHKTQE